MIEFLIVKVYNHLHLKGFLKTKNKKEREKEDKTEDCCSLEPLKAPWNKLNRKIKWLSDQIRSDQSLSRVRLFGTPWSAARQASLSITNSRSSLRLKSIESVMPSSHLILCCPLFLLPPIPPSIRVFSNESTLHMRWPTYWTFSFSIIPSKEIPGLISFRMDRLDLLALEAVIISARKLSGPLEEIFI